MSKIMSWIKRETLRLIPIVIYFAVSFNVIHFAQSLMMQPEDIRYTGYFGATIGALIAGKVILLTDELPFINAFPNKPALYNIISRFCIYGIAVLIVEMLDMTYHQYRHSGNWAFAISRFMHDLGEPLFWGVQIFVLSVFLVYIVYSEVARVIGVKKMRKIFLG